MRSISYLRLRAPPPSAWVTSWEWYSCRVPTSHLFAQTKACSRPVGCLEAPQAPSGLALS